MEDFIVVESGAKTRTISGFLRGDYRVIACGGHIVDLPDDELGIDVENSFAWREQPIKQGRSAESKVQRLRKRLKGAVTVYLATDPDREGEAIAADIRKYCLPKGCTVHRIAFNAIVYHTVLEALENPRDIDEDLVEAQRARRSLDRLIGFILSSMTKHDPSGPHCPAVGRVLAPATGLVVDREQEIHEFEPRSYWTLHAALEWNGQEFQADFKRDWDAFEEAKGAALALGEAGEMAVAACEEDPEDALNPPPPYTTAELQDDADSLLGFSPARTMKLAQGLYEGVEIDGKSKALITYMRTDSTRVAPRALNLAKEALTVRPDCGAHLYRGRTWQPRGPSQDAHEAIRPTQPEDPKFFPENLEGKIEEPLRALYRLIYCRFLSSQMVPAVYHTTTLLLRAEDLEAEAVGHRLKSPGFLTIYRQIYPGHGYAESDLAAIPEGTDVTLIRAWPEPAETRPPGRYREGSLVRELKDRGIGRPSTYGDILEKIQGYRYVRKVGRTLRPTERGEAFCRYLRERYPHAIDYEYTARMEEELEKIQQGEESYEEYLKREFEWLREPYHEAEGQGWMDDAVPTPRQLGYLEQLAEETDADVPDSAFESKQEASEWIDKLKESRTLQVELTPIEETDVKGVHCHRFRLRTNMRLSDEEHAFLKGKKMKYRSGKGDNASGYVFQRRDPAVVKELWEELKDRYSGDDSPLDAEFECHA